MPDHAIAEMKVQSEKVLCTFSMGIISTLPPVCRETKLMFGQRTLTAFKALSTIAELTSTRFSGVVP